MYVTNIICMSCKCDNLTEYCQRTSHFKSIKRTPIIPNLQSHISFFFPFLARRNVILLVMRECSQCEVEHVDKPCTWRGVLRLTGAQTIKTDKRGNRMLSSGEILHASSAWLLGCGAPSEKQGGQF